MWYFTIKQHDLRNAPYQQLQKLASLTEVEVFNEPYYNFCIFEVATENYKETMDYLDAEGITYSLSASKPTRDELLESMR